ncbi:MAG: hypothetical protein LUG18_09445 [Candidatus Azobacteroides sp.]|nr:hypothetical protein [Candidatus Azobacteroides sp.]
MLTRELKDILYASGAVLVGVADMRNISSSPLPYGVCVALPIPVPIIREIEEGPTLSYWHTYNSLNTQLNEIVTKGADFLTVNNYKAISITTGYAQPDEQRRTPLPYKTVATQAGMGWIGKSCLLVTPEYGSAIRISALLTDAPLAYDTPILESRCGTCNLCKTHCPVQALTGTLWKAGMQREELFHSETCVDIIKKRMKELTGIEGTLCGKCFVVCPYTRRYVK